MAKSPASEPSKEVSLFGSKTDVVPAHLQTTAPAGNENVSASDMTIPRLNLLQAISPEIHTVEGAQPGLFLNTLTSELYEAVNVINLFFQKDYAVFKKRKLGGGIEGNFPTLLEAQECVAALPNPLDFDIVDTDKHFCLLLDDVGKPVCPVLLYMSSSKLKISKQWNTDIQLKGKNADRFAGVWNLSSVNEVNRRNERYENMSVEFMGWAPEALYEEAKRVYAGFTTQAAEKAAA